MNAVPARHMRTTLMLGLLLLVQAALLVACGTEPTQRVLAPEVEPPALSRSGDDRHGDDDDDPRRSRFSGWSAPTNVGPPVNTPLAEQAPGLSKDGRTLYFACLACPGGFGGTDIWVSHRSSVDDEWGLPQNLGPAINTSANEAGPSLSLDGRRLYFNSNRPGGFGGNDLYVARRRNKRDDLGWRPAENLGATVNTPANDAGPHPFENEKTGRITLYFASDRAGTNDIYASVRQRNGVFGPPLLVAELSSPFTDQGIAIRGDGLEAVLASDRPGTLGMLDLWVSTRASTRHPWSTPVNLGAPINSAFIDAGPELSYDGTALYFHSAGRAGNVRISARGLVAEGLGE
jgi:hypothetical protein